MSSREKREETGKEDAAAIAVLLIFVISVIFVMVPLLCIFARARMRAMHVYGRDCYL
jgi:ABC-type sulfate transport system permease subunit